ncbi:MAG TPA: TatD family hydrolase [Methanospirillum sp.]|uniref:TatD family hydrolase n=1 Tax=Methanospirillum sp. TaxID=45200 RepID=UPI002C77BEE8|nr:TatD family hydrolase [Methanospirillum sp.]HWQ65222.1 TatD family hydrolase [Methanospirillum sp.]
MKTPKFPVLDDHIHIDPRNGRGIDAIKDFKRSGGTHICLVTKPSWSLDVHPSSGNDYSTVFDETLEIAKQIEEQGIVVFPLLGVHPAEITVLTPRLTLKEATTVMKKGLDCAATYVREGKAIGLKSGRPHYETSPKILAASNEVLSHALTLGGELGCAVQIHAETGPCDDVVEMARSLGMDPLRVIKHFGSPETPLMPSLVAKHESIPELCLAKRRFTMESDYMDENERPGAVMGPRSVPRQTTSLLQAGKITEEDIFRIHQETPEQVYGVEIRI